MAIFTIDIGGTKCSAAAVHKNNVTHLHTWPTGKGGPDLTLVQALRHFDKLTESGMTFEAVGVCFGGPVDPASNIVYTSVHKDGWDGFNFSHWAQRTVNLPIAIDNDANVGAFAEYSHGGHPKVESLLYVTLSTGIGAGFIANGTLLHGFGHGAGELGHVRITDQQLECQCGRMGCFERLCSGSWLERSHGRPAAELLADDTFLAQYTKNLARGFANAVLLYNPELLVIGGGVSQTGSRLTESLEVTLKGELGSWSHLQPQIALSKLGPSGVHLGAMELARAVL